MKYPITLEALEVLDAIDSKGSFAAAANALYRVPSAVTYTVQKLEQDLDVVLFVKEGRRAVLTEAGQLLLQHGREILQATERLAIATKNTHSGFEPVFNIAIDSVLAFDFIYPIINGFYQVYPDIEINLYEEVLGGTAEALTSGRAQLVLGVGAEAVQARGINSASLRWLEWVFCVAPGHALLDEPLPLSLSAIERHRFVVVRDSARHQAALSQRLLSRRPVLSVPTIAEKITALHHGLGVGYLPLQRVQAYLDQGQLVALPVDHADTSAEMVMAWKANNRGKVLAWFVGQIGEVFL